MLYQQKVILKKINPNTVIKSFHDFNFIEFLIKLQPVRIKYWNGINNGQEAAFKFWFFGWREFKVVHKNYKKEINYLYFEDIGRVLPFGIIFWHHHHTILSYGNGTMIIDKVHFDFDNFQKKILFYPIMLFPIIIRKLTYRLWFYIITRSEKKNKN